jgi:hypothetical protein
MKKAWYYIILGMLTEGLGAEFEAGEGWVYLSQEGDETKIGFNPNDEDDADDETVTLIMSWDTTDVTDGTLNHIGIAESASDVLVKRRYTV